MKLKTSVAAIVLVALVGIAGALYYSGMLAPLIKGGAFSGSSAQDAPKVFGTLTAATPASVTVMGQDGKAATFAVNGQTQVITQVAAGETGKALEQLPLQSLVMVIPDAARTSALVVSPLPPLPPMPAPGAAIISTEGAIRSKTATGLVLRQDEGSSVEILVSASTSVVSNVAAGGVGAGFDSLAFGDRVSVIGTRNADESIDALQLLIVSPEASSTSTAR